MKPTNPPNLPGKTEAERFDNAIRAMFRVSKADLLKEEAKAKRGKERRKAPRQPQ